MALSSWSAESAYYCELSVVTILQSANLERGKPPLSRGLGQSSRPSRVLRVGQKQFCGVGQGQSEITTLNKIVTPLAPSQMSANTTNCRSLFQDMAV